MRVWLIFCFFSITNCTFGQIVNIENRRIYDDTLGWSGAIDASMSQVKNDQLFLSLALRGRVQFKTKKHYYLVLLDENFSGSASATYSNAGMAHLRYAYRLQGKNALKKSPWKWESYAQAQYNSVLDLEYRGVLGTGIRVKFLNKEWGKMFLGSSFFIENEWIRSSGDRYYDTRWSNYFSWFINVSKKFSFTAATYVQPNTEGFKDFRYMGQYSMSLSVMKNLDLRAEFNGFYDAVPAPGVNNWVYSSVLGIRVKLGE
jgi:hypothetical protein